jgi:flagellar basal body rod protein FlgC
MNYIVQENQKCASIVAQNIAAIISWSMKNNAAVQRKNVIFAKNQ